MTLLTTNLRFLMQSCDCITEHTMILCVVRAKASILAP